jgi:pyruvate dehydrogenase E2 component (dihydrolipoamide acetyltransferase)
MTHEVLMPNLGAAAEEATLLQWFVAEGQEVAVGQPFFEVESDKSTVVVEVTDAGRVARLLAEAGDTVAIGTPVALLDVPGEESSSPTAMNASAAATSTPNEPALGGTEGAVPVRRGAHASPRAVAMAQQVGVDLDAISGTGPDGRILEADVRSTYMRAGVGPAPTGVPGSPASARLAALSGPRGVIACRLADSAHTTAAVTLTREVAGDPIARARAALRSRHPDVADALSFDLLLAAITARALIQHPALNASLGPDGIVVHRSVHVGIAIDGASGLVVPVLRDVAERSITDLAADWRGLRQRALDGTAAPGELSGGTFTITNLGKLGVDAFTPIINPGECAILGIGRMIERAVVRDGRLTVGKTAILSLTFDHRLVDGAPAARFLGRLAELVEHPDESSIVEAV